jgi:hypothetical protein
MRAAASERRRRGAIGPLVAVVVAGLRRWVLSCAQALMLPEDDAAEVVAQLSANAASEPRRPSAIGVPSPEWQWALHGGARDLEEDVGVTCLVEPAPAGEVLAGELSAHLLDRVLQSPGEQGGTEVVDGLLTGSVH